DGIFTALFVLQRMVDTGKRLSELASVIGTYPQVIENAAVDPGLKGRASTDKAIERKRRQFERELGGAGRILIRPSGTESLVRVMVEGSDIGRIAAMAKELASLIEGGLGRPG
ncbi:MAG: phosphoglucosamine mutase, partial [Oscillospiraceae bacterium]|nr:phosphoglucosamine mutase [Oscillospiraceae bacterium]